MYDLSHLTKILLAASLILVSVNGALAVTLLKLLHSINIPLILYTVFEWSSGIVSFTFLTNILRHCPQKKSLSKILQSINWISNFFSTVVGIYFINSLVYQDTSVQFSLKIRQLQVSLITTFIVSITLKCFTLVNSYNSFLSQDLTHRDLESMPGAGKRNNETPSTYSESLKSDSAQLMNTPKYSSSIISSFEDIPIENVANNNNVLNLQLAKMFQTQEKSLISQSGEIINQTEYADTTTNSNINVNANINTLLHNISMPNLKSNLPPLITSNLLEEKDKNHTLFQDNLNKTSNDFEKNKADKTSPSIIQNPEFHFPNFNDNIIPDNTHFFEDFTINDREDDEDRKIQLLNISEPAFVNHYIKKNNNLSNKLNNISLADWNKNDHDSNGLYHRSNIGMSDMPFIANNEDINSTFHNHQADDFNHKYETENNVLLDELRKEIQENDMQKLRHHESVSKLSSSSRSSFNKTLGRKTLTRVLKGSISSSALNSQQTRHKTSFDSLRLSHHKSNSMSTLSTTKTKSHSPLKIFLNHKEPITPLDLDCSSPTDNYQCNIDLANSIRTSPRKKSMRLKPSNSRSKKLLSFSSLQDIKSRAATDRNYSIHELNKATQLTKFNNLSTDDKINPLITDLIGPATVKELRVFSGTDKSTISNSSVPSGYYGEYDKEKWKVIKKVTKNLSESNSPDSEKYV